MNTFFHLGLCKPKQEVGVASLCCSIGAVDIVGVGGRVNMAVQNCRNENDVHSSIETTLDHHPDGRGWAAHDRHEKHSLGIGGLYWIA